MTPTRRAVLVSSLAGLGGCLGSADEVSVECPVPVDADGAARLGFVGDVMLGRNVDERWRDDPTGVWDGMADRLDALDGLFLNLECCVSARGDPRPGRTFHFRAHPSWAVPALDSAGTVFASLANNHVLDFGPRALTDTLTHLEDAGVPTAGAGPDRASAFEPAHLAVGGLDVAVVAVTDQSPSYAARADAAGAAYAPLRPSDRLTRHWVGGALARARERDPDLLVVSLHWGPNWETAPSETQQSFARWLVDRGADVVHGHSAHVIQGVETYRGRPIVYDAGDFVDDYLVKDGLHNDRSFLFELVVTDGTLSALELVPVEITNSRVTPADDVAARWLRDRMRSLSAPFGTSVERDGAGLRIPLGDC
ncbi:CapA family protein [Halomicroarcula sp. F13]|uniref:CapA family protein n=1 Tax=Haloarcula rubra TaxID=2487747 RepID=A0AAW4PS17_9EURY|nr:CapA family protein [Halomicroarcula rubra]MBX0323929.1 CapA family protein [Halomicroarcula rubra]